MIKDLIKLANELDKIGLHEHSDKIDQKIYELSKEAQDAGIMAPTPGSTFTELGLDFLKNPVTKLMTAPATWGIEGGLDLLQGKSFYESYMPNFLKTVEGFMSRKDPILQKVEASFAEEKESVQKQSSTLEPQAISQKIKEKVEALDLWIGGSWNVSNYYRNIERVAPEVYKLSYALGYKGEEQPSKDSIGLSSVPESLSSRTTSYLDTNYREAGRWILWQVILEGHKDGRKDRIESETPVTTEPVAPAPSTPSSPRPEVVGIPLTPIKHPVGTNLSGSDAGGWAYKVTGTHSFDWKNPEGKTGTFVGQTYAPKRWNDAAEVINNLKADSDGATTSSPPVVPQPPSTSTPQPSNTKNNVEIILSRTAAGAVFSLGTIQNEMARLRRLIENGMTIPKIAEEVVMQHGTALEGLPLTTDKTEDVNKMSNSEMRKRYKTEIDLIMSTINRIYKSKK